MELLLIYLGVVSFVASLLGPCGSHPLLASSQPVSRSTRPVWNTLIPWTFSPISV